MVRDDVRTGTDMEAEIDIDALIATKRKELEAAQAQVATGAVPQREQSCEQLHELLTARLPESLLAKVEMGWDEQEEDAYAALTLGTYELWMTWYHGDLGVRTTIGDTRCWHDFGRRRSGDFLDEFATWVADLRAQEAERAAQRDARLADARAAAEAQLRAAEELIERTTKVVEPLVILETHRYMGRKVLVRQDHAELVTAWLRPGGGIEVQTYAADAGTPAEDGERLPTWRAPRIALTASQVASLLAARGAYLRELRDEAIAEANARLRQIDRGELPDGDDSPF